MIPEQSNHVVSTIENLPAESISSSPGPLQRIRKVFNSSYIVGLGGGKAEEIHLLAKQQTPCVIIPNRSLQQVFTVSSNTGLLLLGQQVDFLIFTTSQSYIELINKK